MAQSENFYLDQLNVSVSALFADTIGSNTTSFSGDATALVTIPQNVVQQLFQFSSDSVDINNETASDILYRVVYNSGSLGLNIDTGAEVIVNPIDSAASNNNVSYDWVRYLALKLFNTHLGVDLFANESNQRSYLNERFGVSFDTKLKQLVSDGISDATGSSASKSILNQILENQRSRLQDITQLFVENVDGKPWYRIPILESDTLYFTLQINPANSQNSLTNVGQSIEPRTYLIQANITAEST